MGSPAPFSGLEFGSQFTYLFINYLLRAFWEPCTPPLLDFGDTAMARVDMILSLMVCV